MVILLMGVSGTGKTTVGRALAESLGWPFIDADDFHPPQNRAKMARGLPLTDSDRRPWLQILRGIAAGYAASGQSAVLACSALKQSYRNLLREGIEAQVPIVHLVGPSDLIRRRMRPGDEFLKPGMLESQFEALEPPLGAVQVNIHPPVDQIVAEIRRALKI